MNKYSLYIFFGTLFLVSVVFNLTQYHKSKILKEKLTFFESRLGSYESNLEYIKKAEEAKDKSDHTIKVYFTIEASESDILNVKSSIEIQNGVESIQYVSANQALNDFKTKHQNDPATLEALNEIGTNPLGAILIITITDPSKKEYLNNYIKANVQNSIIDHTSL